jgi:deferrochelatase/peroxidase EfeB
VVHLADGTTAGGTFPPATADPNGRLCPFPAHIRKVNPRDDPSDTSGPRNTKTRLMLRRGIPYGPATKTPQPLEDDGADRGLLFMSYQASIDNQFEFVTRTWVNRANAPHDSAPTTGHDPIIGQDGAGRFIRCALIDAQIDMPADPWVETTGGGYFFTPSISAIATVLAAD